MWTASSHHVRSAPFDPFPRPWPCMGSILMPSVPAPAARRRLPRHKCGPEMQSTNWCSFAELHRQPGRHTVRGRGDAVGPASGSSHIGTCYEFVSIYVLCGWHQPLALWPIEPTIFAPESNPWTAVGKDRRRAAILAAAPSPPLELQRRSQSMPCMKHLIEAERESSVPSSKPRKTSDG